MNIAASITYTEAVKELMGKKSYLLSKAQALSDIGMIETAQSLFLSVASYEEQIAALLDTDGHELEAAIHRISAASCYAKADRLSHAVNLYRAALSGPLQSNTRADVLKLLGDCLSQFAQQSSRHTTPSLVSEVVVGN